MFWYAIGTMDTCVLWMVLEEMGWEDGGVFAGKRAGVVSEYMDMGC